MGTFASFGALVVVLVIAVFATWAWYGEDFVTYYAPAKVILAGQNPYEYDQIVATIFNATGCGGNSPFYYPLWITFPVFPLAILPLQISRLLWLVAEVVFWVMGLRLTSRLFREQVAPWTRWLVWLFGFLLFGWATLRAEQIAFALLFDWAFCMWAIQHSRRKTAAITMALLLIKPNVTFLPFIVLCLYAWRKDKRILLGAFAALALLFSTSTLVTPGWWEPIVAGRLPNGWNQGLSGYEIDARRLTTTTADFLDYNLGIQQAPAVFIQMAIGLIAAYLIWRWRSHVLYNSMLSIPLGLMITPYAMQYDYALLTPGIFWVVHRFHQLDRARQWAVSTGLILLASVIFWEKPVTDGLWLSIILAVLILLTAPLVSPDFASRSQTPAGS